MKNWSITIVRVGTAITFLWIGVLIFKQPEAWGAALQPWAAGILPVPIGDAMIGTAILDIVIGFFLLVDKYTLVFSAIGFVHLVVVLTVVGIDSITARDIAIAAATLAIFFAAWPERNTQEKIT